MKKYSLLVEKATLDLSEDNAKHLLEALRYAKVKFSNLEIEFNGHNRDTCLLKSCLLYTSPSPRDS